MVEAARGDSPRPDKGQERTRSTKGDGRDSAVVCRERGWDVGTLLVGDEGYGPTIIEITALGQRNILAKALAHDGEPRGGRESNWVLWCRDWREAKPHEVPQPLEPGQRVMLNLAKDKGEATVIEGPDDFGAYLVEAADGRRGRTKALLPVPDRSTDR